MCNKLTIHPVKIGIMTIVHCHVQPVDTRPTLPLLHDGYTACPTDPGRGRRAVAGRRLNQAIKRKGWHNQ